MIKQITEEISVEEFQKTGILLYINQVMQPFGLSIAIKNGTLIPIKSKYRGFGEQNVKEAYHNLNNYLLSNIQEITDVDTEI